MKTKLSTEKNQLSIEQKKVIEDEQDEEEDLQIDDQEKITEIDQPTLEEKVLLQVQTIQEENDLISLKRNSVTRPRIWGKKIFEIKNHTDPKESSDPRKNFELKEIFEQRNHSEIHLRIWEKKVSEIKRSIHQENRLRNNEIK